MTLSTVQNFQTLSALSTPRPQAAHKANQFVPWSHFGAIMAESNSAAGAFHVAVPLSPEESKQQKLLQELEQKKASVLQEIQLKENEINGKIEELNQREDVILQKEKELNAELEFVKSFSKDFTEIKKGYWAENAHEIVDFSLNLVEKLVMERIVEDPRILINHIKTVLEEMKIDEPILIHLSPDDLDSLQHSATAAIKELIEDPKIKWLGDLRLARGEINIDTSQYRLDASILTAIGNLREDFKIQNQNQIQEAEAQSVVQTAAETTNTAVQSGSLEESTTEKSEEEKS